LTRLITKIEQKPIFASFQYIRFHFIHQGLITLEKKM
jgi:hypothetical protein